MTNTIRIFLNRSIFFLVLVNDTEFERHGRRDKCCGNHQEAVNAKLAQRNDG